MSQADIADRMKSAGKAKPSHERKHYYAFLRAPDRGERNWTALQDEYMAYFCHFLTGENKTVPCLRHFGFECPCEFVDHPNPELRPQSGYRWSKWRGFIYGHCWTDDAVKIIEITEKVSKDILKKLMMDVELCGQSFRYTRTRAKGPVVCTPIKRYPREEILAIPKFNNLPDLGVVLAGVWGLDERIEKEAEDARNRKLNEQTEPYNGKELADGI